MTTAARRGWGGRGTRRPTAAPPGPGVTGAQLSRLGWLASGGGWDDRGYVGLSAGSVVPGRRAQSEGLGRWRGNSLD